MVDNAPPPQQAPDVFNVEMDGNKIGETFQRYITDTNPLLQAFYQAWCGHRAITRTETSKVLGKQIENNYIEYVIDYNSRIINESGAGYVLSAVSPLISPLTTTSNLSDREVYNLWNSKRIVIRHTLLRSYFVDTVIIYTDPSTKKEVTKVVRNPYELNPFRVADITTTVLSLYAVTNKSKGGFTLKQLSESIMTLTSIKNGIDPHPRNEGAIERIQKALGKG